MTSTAIVVLIVCFLVLNYILENGLEILNANYSWKTLPRQLETFYSKEKYAQSCLYQKDNRRLSYISSAFMFLVSLVFFLMGGFGWLDTLLRTVTTNTILLSLLYFACIGLVVDIISTPFSWYETFVIEQKFGFNKTTPKLFILDKLKTLLLAIIVGGGIIALIVWIYTLSPKWFWLIAWGAISLFSVFMGMFYSQLIVPLFNKQTPLQDGELRTEIEKFAQKTGFKLKNVFVIDGSKRSAKSNAYFTGLGSKKRIVLYDTLINNHTTEELIAILAHEVGHYKKKHIVKGMIVSLLQSLLMFYILGLFLNSPVIAQAMGGSTPSFHVNIIAFALLYTPVSMLFSLLGNMLSRKHEYEADSFAVKNTSANAMAKALQKLSVDNLSNLCPHPLYVFFHYSHPTVLQRLERIGVVLI